MARTLSSLESLNLSRNRLRSLGTRPFYYLIELEELNLEKNQLTDLDEDVFESETYRYETYDDWGDYHYHDSSLKGNLLELNLGGNRLTALPGVSGDSERCSCRAISWRDFHNSCFRRSAKIRWVFLEFPGEFVMKDSIH